MGDGEGVCQAARLSLPRRSATGRLTGVRFRNDRGEWENQEECGLEENRTPGELHAEHQALLGLVEACHTLQCVDAEARAASVAPEGKAELRGRLHTPQAVFTDLLHGHVLVLAPNHIVAAVTCSGREPMSLQNGNSHTHGEGSRMSPVRERMMHTS